MEHLVQIELNGSELSDDLYYRNTRVLKSIYLCQLMLEKNNAYAIIYIYLSRFCQAKVTGSMKIMWMIKKYDVGWSKILLKSMCICVC